MNYPWPLFFSAIIAFASFSLSFQKDFDRRKFVAIFIFNVLQFALITGLRDPNSGVDTIRYTLYFNSFHGVPLYEVWARPWTSISFLIWEGDTGFNLIAWLSAQISSDPRVYYTFLNIVMASLLGLGIYIRKNLTYSHRLFALFLLLFSYSMILHFGNTVRQGISVALLFLAWSIFTDYKKLSFISVLLLVLSAYIHMLNTIVFVALFIATYVVKLVIKSKKALYIFLAVALGISFFLPLFVDILGNSGSVLIKLQRYAYYGFDPEMYIRILWGVFLLVVVFKGEQTEDISFYMTVILALVFLSQLHELSKRVIPLKMLVEPFIMINIWQATKVSKKGVWLTGLGLTIYMILFLFMPPVTRNYFY